MTMEHLLNSCAVSSSLASREEDDAVAARRLLLGISDKCYERLCTVSLVVARPKSIVIEAS